MVRKIGEAQVIENFGNHLKHEILKKFPNSAKFVFGNFSGSQDRLYADVFAGTESSCMLIEFKEYENEVEKEKLKELRRILCGQLTPEQVALSRRAHFVAYFKDSQNLDIVIEPYVDKVCPFFGIGKPPLIESKLHDKLKFIMSFIDVKQGVSREDFQTYVGILSKIGDKARSGKRTSFRSVLYSYDKAGHLNEHRFKNLGELDALLAPPPAPETHIKNKKLIKK